MANLSEDTYYSGDAILSRNAIINMVVGMRSVGKTYWFKRFCIRKYLERGDQWIYLRRHESQIENVRKDKGQTLLADLANEFPDHELQVKGYVMQIRPKADEGKETNTHKWETMGYMVSLVGYMNLKGTNYDKVRNILFDEFIREPRNKTVDRYLNDEVGAFMNLYNTVDRFRDVVRVYMLANAGDLTNPYFLTWKIGKPNKGFSRYQDNLICLEYAITPKFKEYAASTKSAKLMRGTDYGSFAIDNEFINDSEEFLFISKPQSAKCYYAIAYSGHDFGVWRDIAQGNFYITDGAPKNVQRLAMLRADMRPNIILIKRNETLLRNIMECYRYGMTLFDKSITRELFCEVMEMCGVR